MYVSKEVLENIKNTIGLFEAECGGIIAINQDGVISDYYFDIDAGVGKVSYIPSRLRLQEYIIENWSSPRLQFCGVVHSHPFCNVCRPSCIDIEMAVKIMDLNHMNQFYLFMVQGTEMKLYRLNKDAIHSQSCQEENIEVF